jgi:uncharacterized membrane protein YqiK
MVLDFAISQGEGEAAAMLMRANAQAEAIQILTRVISQQGGQEAAKLFIAKEVGLFEILICPGCAR